MAIRYSSDAQKILEKYKINQPLQNAERKNQGQFSSDAEAILEKYGVAGRNKVSIPQVQTPAGSSSVADLLPKPNDEAAMRNYAAQMQQRSRYGAGNIDLYNRPQYRNEDGSISTVDSRGYNIDGVETLLPSVWMKNGKPYHSNDDDEIVQHYYDTGEYLGKFNSVAESNDYAQKLHQQQEEYYTPSMPEQTKLTESEFNRSSAMQEKYGSYRNYLNSSKLENLKKSSYGESNAPRIDTSKVTHSSGNFVNVENMNPLQRIWNSAKRTLTGGLKNSLGSNVNTQGVAYQGGQNTRNEYYNDQMAQYQKELDTATQRQNYMKQHISDGQFTQADVDAEQNYIDYYNMMLGAYGTGLAAQEGATKETYKLADKVVENAEKDIQSAKDTSYGGKLGEMLVDAGASTVQSSADAVASMLLTGQNPLKGILSGAPVAEVLRTNAANATHTMAPFVIRAFGGGAQKARQEMEAKGTANDENAFAKQVAYGVADAAKEYITEKLGNIGAGGVYADADGFLDEFWDLVGEGFAESLTKSAAGRRIISGVTSAFVGEGAEEAIGDYLDYIFSLSDIYGGADETLLKDWKAGNGLGEKAKNVAKGLANKLYDATEDFVVGGLSGAMGGAAQTANEIAGTAAVGRDFRNMGVQNAQDFIDTGLESIPGTESRQLAQLLQQKQNAGKNISNYELGRLYNANVEAIDAENKAREELIRKQNRGNFTQPVEQENANTTGGNIVLPTAAERGMMPTYAQSTELNAVVQQAKETGEVTRGMVERVMKSPAMMQEIGIAQNARGSNARAEVKSRLESLANTENRDIIDDNGIANQNQQKIVESNAANTGNRFAMVQNAAEEVANNGGEQSAGGERWQRSLAAAEQSESVAGFQTEAGNVREGKSDGRSALPADYRSGVNLGIETAVDADEDTTKTLREVTEYNDDQKAIISYAKKKGQTVRFYTGDLWVKDTPDGTPYRVRGLIHSDGKTIWIKADHSTYSAKQIYMHEDFHAAVMQSKKVLDEGIKRIKRKYANDPAGLRRLIDSYVERYHIDDTNLSDEYILEEILADAHAGIDVETKSRSGEKETADFKKAADKAIKKRTSKKSETSGTRFAFDDNGVIYGAEYSKIKSEDKALYFAAKKGDAKAALDLVEKYVSEENVMAIAAFGDTAYLIPVVGKEGTSSNDIPYTIAKVISSKTGQPVFDGVYQQKRLDRTKTTRMDRYLSEDVLFDKGDEIDYDTIKGKRFVMIDDNTTIGTTLRGLSNFLMEHGGEPVGAYVLSVGGDNARFINVTDETWSEIEKEGYEDVKEFAERNGYAKEFVRAELRESAAWSALQAFRRRNNSKNSRKNRVAGVSGKTDGGAGIAELKNAVENEKPIATTTEAKASREFDEDYMDAAEKANGKNKYADEKAMKQARKDRKAIHDYMEKISDMLPADITGNTFYSDSSYGGSEENSTVCVRSMAYEEFLDAVADELGRPLTVEDTTFICQEAMALTDKPECLYCYVAMDRKAYREYLGNYIEQRDAFLEDIRKGMEPGLVKPVKKAEATGSRAIAKDTAYGKFLNGRANTVNMYRRAQLWMDSEKLITKKDLASIASMNRAAQDPAIRAQVADAQAYAQSASWAKKKNGFAAYNNHILKWSKAKVDKLNKHYGLRMYSFSDYSPAFILENMQQITDAAVKGLKVLGYTKELDFVRIFAPTGMNINISVFGYNDRNTGDIAMDAMQGADWEQAKALRDQYSNVGCTFVATNDAQVEWALSQDWIDVVIPFHLVRTGANVASMFGWKNYTDMSADKKNPNWEKGNAKSIYPSEHQNDRDLYLELCEENNLTPRFEQWVENPNYMKLVNETRQSDAETKSVQPIFDMTYAEASLDEMVKRGGYVQHLGGTSENMRAIASETAEKINGKTKDEVRAKVEGRARYSLDMVDPVQPKSDAWERGATTDEVREAHPTLYAVDEEATEERNPTQVKGTIGSYRKVYNILRDEGFNGTILDASSGLGYGTEAGRSEYGFNVDDIEPYPDSDYNPKYTDYSKLKKKYDVIISNAVLNVIPQDQRDALVVKMGQLLKDGGRMFINVRGKDVLNSSGKIAINEKLMEYFIPRTAKTGSYQKGFTANELKAYLEDALGEGYTVEKTNKFGAVSAIVTKAGAKASRDTEYEELAKYPNKNEAKLQKMVDDKAKEAGYNTETPLYHGTGSFGFTEFDLSKMDDKRSIFTTDNDEVAESYSGKNGARRISDAKKPVNKQSKPSEIADALTASTYGDSVYVAVDSKEKARLLREKRSDIEFYIDDIMEFYADNEGMFNEEKTNLLLDIREDIENIMKAKNPNQVKSALNSYTDHVWDMKWMDEDVQMQLFASYAYAKGGAPLNELINKAAKRISSLLADGDAYICMTGPFYGSIMSTDEAISWIKSSPTSQPGIYKLYGNKGRSITIDCDGCKWNRIDGRHIGQSSAFVTTREVSEWAQNNGYDSVTFHDIVDIGSFSSKNTPSDVTIFFDPSQVKSADPVTYNNNGEIIPLSERFNPKSTDIRFSREESPEWRQNLDKMAEDYGKMPAGENPQREISMPNKTSDNRKLSMTVRTILEAKATPDTMVDTIEQLAEKGDFSYEAYGDKQAIKDAESRVTDAGWDKSLELWKKSIQSGKVSKKNTALGWALYNNAANSGNTDTAIDILNNMVEHQRNAAQALQATRILKKMNPETQLYGAARSVRNLQEELNERYGEENAPKLEIDQGLAEHFMKAKNDSERAEALKEIYRDIGRQMPSRFIDKVNAWRYLAMLGNARTHFRNVIGNAGFAPVVAVKDLTATAIESIVSRTANIERTKAIVSGKGGKELLSAAWNDYANISEDAMGGGKYTDLVNANKYIEEGKRVFGTSKVDLWNKTGGKALETARQKNGELLDKEDQWFSQPHYAYALAQYCKANGITAEQIAKGGKALEKARAYAIKEAQKATYRDTNDFSQFISNLGRSRMMSKNRLTKGVSMLVEGILPFRKTPANILARGMEYSPLGLIKSLSYDLNQVKNGKMDAAEAIDNISAGLTGTGLLALGVFLSSLGLVRGKGDDDEKKNEFEDLLGHQNYALELPNGKSVTLDWLAPEALPFFVGTNLWEQTGKIGEGVTLDTVLTAITDVSEPLLEMSCLQSLNDLFESYGYSKGKNGLTRTIVSGATSYLTQFVPTIFGQIERSLQENRMTTYTNKTGFLNNTDLQYLIGGVSAKIPGWDYRQIEYIDAWGRTESSGGFVKRALNNFLNPAYTSEVTVSDMENELIRLYEATGENVFPSRADKYFTVDKQRKDLTEEEYVEYAKQKGETSYAVATSMTGSSAYKKLSDADKAKAISDAYSYANQIAKKKVGGYDPESWVTEAKAAYEKHGVPIATYILIKTELSGIEAIKGKDGKSISNSKGLRIMQKVYNNYPSLTKSQRDYLFGCFDVGKTVIGYSKPEVESALKNMKTK